MARLRSPTDFRVAVDGGELNVAEWPGAQGPLVCVHGLTSSSRAFAGLAAELPDTRVLAVDCRGRGLSTKAGPFGLEQHATDLLAALDAAQVEKATLVGHSMGAYVVAAAAALAPGRVQSIVFIDGGYFLEFPTDLTPEQLLNMMLGTFLEKLRRTWSTFEEYLAFYETTALYPDGVDDYGRASFAYDLTGEPPELRSRIVEDCIAPDWRDVIDHAPVTRRLESLTAPLLVVRAPGGLTGVGDEVLPDAVREVIHRVVPHAQFVDVAGTNHHTVLLSRPGAAAVATAIRAFSPATASA